ncbi:MAG: hypothetical protein ACOC0S_06840 [Desulfohalobiaceae bacterium]
MAVEALQPEQTMVLQTSLIPFLQDERVQQAGKIPKCAGLQDLESFCRTINRQSLQIVNKEISFFSEYKPATSSVLEFYQGLMKQILALDKEPHKCILRLAWGSGWLGMTGDWMDQSTMQAVRQEKNLGRKGFPFPKTRRLAMKDGQPRLPLGWVLLEPDESMRQEFQAAARLTRPAPETGKETQGAAPAAEAKQGEKPPAAKSPEELRQETVQELRAALKQAGSGLSGQIDFMLERIQAQEDSQTREEMCSELIKAAKKLKSFKKARQAGKPWVVKIEELARSCGLEL